MAQEKKYDVFISYSRKDFDEVNAFVEMLKQRIPTLNIWFDIDGIESGDEFDEKIIDAIENSFCVIFALSDHSLQSKWTKDEVMYAKNIGIKVIPVLLSGATLKGWFLFKFGRVDYIDLQDEKQMKKILTNISSWLEKDLLDNAYQQPTMLDSAVDDSSKNSLKEVIESPTILPDEVPEKQLPLQTKAIVSSSVQHTGRRLFMINGVEFTMVSVLGGSFMMGATDEQGAEDPFAVEKPIHKVEVPDFMIAETVVTQALWKAVMGTGIEEQSKLGTYDTTIYGEGENYPMYYLSWHDCIDFIIRLNALTGEKFRLPTEAEWEFAARGGIRSKGYKYAGSDSIANVAWYEGNSGNQMHPVAKKQPNELGLYDMSGNVWEWCNNWFYEYDETNKINPQGPPNGIERMSRGGGWNRIARRCRVSYRGDDLPELRANVGFRLVLSINQD